jgi:DNA-binding transcriptional MocR family regulator
MIRKRQGETAEKGPLYEELADTVAEMIAKGTYRPGERIPSIRGLSRQMRLSINTVMRAYVHLENLGMIEAVPQSGYYVRCRTLEPERLPAGRRAATEIKPYDVTLRDITFQVMRSLSDPLLVPLGRGIPNPELLPVDKLNRMLGTESRRFRLQSVSYTEAAGNRRLRTQIARRTLDAGCALSPDDILVTSGCREAVTIALHSICRPGDTIAVESPVYYSFLRSIEWLGLRILEIPSSPQDGINLDILSYAMKHNPLAACVLISNYSNPLGGVMPDEKKKDLVQMLGTRNVPLIEDDVYGDLSFSNGRPASCKAYDRKGLVIVCSSFSKTLAPGYRIGWMVPGRLRDRVERLKTIFNVATASPTQLAVAEFLANGGYDHHLRTVRKAYARQTAQMREAIGRYFPDGTRVTRPEGGFILWVEMPEQVDAVRLYHDALKRGISIAPGPIFTMGDRFTNCIRLNAAFWSTTVEQALETIGALALQKRPVYRRKRS